MERSARRRLRVERSLLRQHPEFGRIHMAACDVSGAAANGGAANWGYERSVPLGFSLGSLQTHRGYRMPGGLPHWVNRAHRYRFRPCTKRRMQWLRVLHSLMSLWRD